MAIIETSQELMLQLHSQVNRAMKEKIEQAHPELFRKTHKALYINLSGTRPDTSHVHTYDYVVGDKVRFVDNSFLDAFEFNKVIRPAGTQCGQDPIGECTVVAINSNNAVRTRGYFDRVVELPITVKTPCGQLMYCNPIHITRA